MEVIKIMKIALFLKNLLLLRNSKNKMNIEQVLLEWHCGDHFFWQVAHDLIALFKTCFLSIYDPPQM